VPVSRPRSCSQPWSRRAWGSRPGLGYINSPVAIWTSPHRHCPGCSRSSLAR
jgi:hypothetical protein